MSGELIKVYVYITFIIGILAELRFIKNIISRIVKGK